MAVHANTRHFGAPLQTVSVPVSRMSSEEEPTRTPYEPRTTAHACFDTSQIEKLRSSSSKVSVALPPAGRLTDSKPLSCRGGSPAAAGNLR